MTLTRSILALIAAASLAGAVAIPAAQAAESPTPPRQTWSFAGPFGKYDQGQLQRGFKVYKVVCAACHSIKLLRFRNLAEPGGPGFSTAQAAAIAAEYKIKDGFLMVVFCILFAWFVFYLPNYMGHADNYIPANPAVTPTHIVPDWYYLPFYAILRAIPNKLMGVAALFGSIAILAFLPWLDTSRVRSARYRPLFKQFFWVFVAVCVGLGWLGSKPAEGGYVIAARIFTFYYFAHFLIVLPLLGLFEKTRPLPNSITESV
jgi:hypothetical protein